MPAARKWKAIGGPFFAIVSHGVKLSPVFGPMFVVGLMDLRAKAAFIEVVVLFAAIAATTIAFWPRSMAAGLDLGLVVLNFTIWRLDG